ncbi:hypothetical protein MVES1_003441 [Malassezia vespertilionis]|uniref:Uncharacterized protein n=1 Tax=Malassezia vespertilionis TaxID=2020962 RepID=A0A2N1J7D6_9BASI|nr:uncharacterized protein MVES1_003441 [Malassezia vespertilionis]PKI82473.1 hypothetical protein MVES_003679 [Malassezia vespertilionis]WFD08072.1 hypothetical protein MVES1_003441 [Malassezia vespertilionis]
MSSFKVRLRVPGPRIAGDGERSEAGEPVPGAPQESDAPATPASGTEYSSSPPEKSAKKLAKPRKTSGPPSTISSVAANLSLEEIDALPSAKRRKSLKTRGAPGPGRGWRKGLSKGQKPVYRLPGDVSTADLPHDSEFMAVHSTTPASFAHMDVPGTRKKGASKGLSAKGMERAPLPSSRMRVSPNSPDATFKYPRIPDLRDQMPLLPLPHIPNFIPPLTPLQRTITKPRHWRTGTREILSLGGRAWRAPTWLSEPRAKDEAQADAQADADEGDEEASLPSSDADAVEA